MLKKYMKQCVLV